MVVYECGNYDESDDPAKTCPFCDAEELDKQSKPYSTVTVNCPGWYEDGEEP